MEECTDVDLEEAGRHVLQVSGDTGEDTAAVNSRQQAGVVAVDKTHSEARQTKVFTEAPHEVSSVWVRELEKVEESQDAILLLYYCIT